MDDEAKQERIETLEYFLKYYKGWNFKMYQEAKKELEQLLKELEV